MRRTVYRWVALLVSLGLFVSACSSGDGDSGDGSGEQGNGEPAPGRTTLEVAALPEPANLVPYGGHGGMLRVYEAMMMLLLTTGPDNEQIESDSLESWEVSDDGRTVTLHVREGIEWNDGTPLTSADVVMTLEHFLDPSIAIYADSMDGVVGLQEFLDGETDSISGVSAPDDYTVVVELEAASPWLAQVAQSRAVVILPEHVLGDVPHDDLADHEYFQNFPVTNGPYNFVGRSSGQHVELERNESWSLGEAGFERLFMKWVDPTVAPAQLETGELQYIYLVDPSDAERLDSIDGMEIISTPRGVATLHLTYQEPLLDRRVRQAMSYAIDREGICDEVFLGYCEASLVNLPMLGPDWAISDDIIQYNYDPSRAQALLDEAGWDPDSELTFLNYQTGTYKRMYEIILGNLADVGMNFKLENVDYATRVERNEDDPKTFEVAGGVELNAFHPSYAHSRLSCDPDRGHAGGYCNEELDALFEAAEVESDQSEEQRLYQDAFRLANEEVPSIYLPNVDDIAVYDSRLKGVQPGPDVYRNIGDWYWEE